MMAHSDARDHLVKAREFLDSARHDFDHDRHHAAVSSAVIAGINCKDAFCLATTGRTNKSDSHMKAVEELKNASAQGAALTTTFRRLLVLKPNSQDQASPVSRSNARDALAWAQKMVDGAYEVVTETGT